MVRARADSSMYPLLRALLAEYDRRGRIVEAAERLAAKWEAMTRCYASTEECVELAELLDALADVAKGVERDGG